MPGTLLNVCGYGLWHKRYVTRDGRRHVGAACTSSLLRKEPVRGPWKEGVWNHISEWALKLSLRGKGEVVLFGCTEDVTCEEDSCEETHRTERTAQAPYCRVMCACCKVPICSKCTIGLRSFKTRGWATSRTRK